MRMNFRIATTLFALGFTLTAGAQWTVISLHPAGASGSYGTDVHGAMQVGFTTLSEVDRAGLWLGTAGSFVDLHLPQAYSHSYARSTDGVQQVGNALLSTGFHAS